MLTSFNVSPRLKLHRRGLCGVRLFWNIKMLRLKWLACCCLTRCRHLSGGGSTSLSSLASANYFSSLYRLPCLSFIGPRRRLSLFALVNSHWSLPFLALLTLIGSHRRMALLALIPCR